MSHPLSKIYSRHQTYRRLGDARRSFYKFVCKREHYGNLRYGNDSWGRAWVRGPEKYNFGTSYARGYPTWNATRSEMRRQWERQFEEHRDRAWEKQREIDAAAIVRVEKELEAKERARLIGNKKTAKFFRMLSAGSAISAK